MRPCKLFDEQVPFRVGSTSYVIPADILPNVRFLAPHVDDIELVLFEGDAGALPSPAVIDQLVDLASLHNLTYTVHLPLDLQLAASDETMRAASVEVAASVMSITAPLRPLAYIVHLNGAGRQLALPGAASRWHSQAIRSLETLADQAGGAGYLAVENLETYDPALLLPLLDRMPISLCIDVGHFLKNSADPLPFLQDHLHRAVIVHLHGAVDGRDHRRIGLIAPEQLRRILALLVGSFRGVLTLEVFCMEHWKAGTELVAATLQEMIAGSDFMAGDQA